MTTSSMQLGLLVLSEKWGPSVYTCAAFFLWLVYFIWIPGLTQFLPSTVTLLFSLFGRLYTLKHTRKLLLTLINGAKCLVSLVGLENTGTEKDPELGDIWLFYWTRSREWWKHRWYQGQSWQEDSWILSSHGEGQSHNTLHHVWCVPGTCLAVIELTARFATPNYFASDDDVLPSAVLSHWKCTAP